MVSLSARQVNVEEALYLVNRGRFDAAVLDVRMPDRNSRSGLDVLDFIRLREDLMSLPVPILTGYFLTDNEQASIRHRRAHVFCKPAATRRWFVFLNRLIRTSEASPSGLRESEEVFGTHHNQHGK